MDDVADEVDALLLRGKGNKERIVPLGADAASALQAYHRSARPAVVASEARPRRRSSSTPECTVVGRAAYGVLQRAAGKAGLGDHVSPHMLRHSFATMLDGGADCPVVRNSSAMPRSPRRRSIPFRHPQRIAEEYASTHPRAR